MKNEKILKKIKGNYNKFMKNIGKKKKKKRACALSK